jgi:hypothetical protein
MRAQDLASELKIICGCALAITAVWLCALIVASRALRKTDETVTLDSNFRTASVSPPAISSAPLPAADGDLEIVGDQIAKAIVHLNRGSRPVTDTDKVNERLKLALRETEQARRQIARGKSGAAALALRTLARQLDAG